MTDTATNPGGVEDDVPTYDPEYRKRYSVLAHTQQNPPPKREVTQWESSLEDLRQQQRAIEQKEAAMRERSRRILEEVPTGDADTAAVQRDRMQTMMDDLEERLRRVEDKEAKCDDMMDALKKRQDEVHEIQYRMEHPVRVVEDNSISAQMLNRPSYYEGMEKRVEEAKEERAKREARKEAEAQARLEAAPKTEPEPEPEPAAPREPTFEEEVEACLNASPIRKQLGSTPAPTPNNSTVITGEEEGEGEETDPAVRQAPTSPPNSASMVNRLRRIAAENSIEFGGDDDEGRPPAWISREPPDPEVRRLSLNSLGEKKAVRKEVELTHFQSDHSAADTAAAAPEFVEWTESANVSITTACQIGDSIQTEKREQREDWINTVRRFTVSSPLQTCQAENLYGKMPPPFAQLPPGTRMEYKKLPPNQQPSSPSKGSSLPPLGGEKERVPLTKLLEKQEEDREAAKDGEEKYRVLLDGYFASQEASFRGLGMVP